MVTITISIQEIPIIATVIEHPSAGFFNSRIRRYLRDTINSIPTLTDQALASIKIDDWVAIWLLSTLYSSEIDGAARSLSNKLEDALSYVEGIAQETTDPIISIS